MVKVKKIVKRSRKSVTEYRVNLKGSNQGNYIIAKNKTDALRKVINYKPHYRKYKVSDFKVVLWKKHFI